MAKDIGKVIWELSKSDIMFDGRNLMEDFIKKVELDKRMLREKIRDIVLNHIKTQIQPFNTYVVLREEDGIIGYLPTVEATTISNDNEAELDSLAKNNPYMKKNIKDGYYVEILSSDTKYLIDHAIIPLNLQWSLSSRWGGPFIISWDHWAKKL